jgi:hypothetical protein
MLTGKGKLRKGELYNLREDIGEQKNVANENKVVMERLNGYLDEMRNDLGSAENCRTPGINMNPQYLEMKSN